MGKAPTSITGYEKGTAKVPKDVAEKFEEWIKEQSSTTDPLTTTTAPLTTTVDEEKLTEAMDRLERYLKAHCA